MIYKCFECGLLFESGEEKRIIEDHGEEYLACPCCGGAYEATVQCKSCEGNFFEDDLYNGWCIECLGRKMTFNNMRQYLQDSALEEDFYIGEFYKSSCDYSSPELIKLARGGFLEAYLLEADRNPGQCSNDNKYAVMLREFILDDHYGLYDYAEWINKREEKK